MDYFKLAQDITIQHDNQQFLKSKKKIIELSQSFADDYFSYTNRLINTKSHAELYAEAKDFNHTAEQYLENIREEIIK